MTVIIQQDIKMKSGGLGFNCAGLKNFSHNIRINPIFLDLYLIQPAVSAHGTPSCVISRDTHSIERPYLMANHATKLIQALITL